MGGLENKDEDKEIFEVRNIDKVWKEGVFRPFRFYLLRKSALGQGFYQRQFSIPSALALLFYFSVINSRFRLAIKLYKLVNLITVQLFMAREFLLFF